MIDESKERGRAAKNEMLHCYSFGLHFGGLLKGIKGKKVTSVRKGGEKGGILGVEVVICAG